MGMYDNINDIVKVLNNDEILLRLLQYYPEDYLAKRPDPLDESLANIIGSDIYWTVISDRIMITPKSSDLEEKKICRIYVYAGRRRPNNNNYLVASQQVTVDILCHNDYEKDLRSMRISDRINDLLVSERITGMGKVEYIDGNPISSPIDYVGYRHIYQFGSTSK